MVELQVIECKLSEKKTSPSLRYLKARFPSVLATQLCLESDDDVLTKEGIRIRAAHLFLSELV
ncbi:MAG: hypothetical protein DRG82_09115 [Deltaproteobacteria bacterium]|nr:MAG: hypothetical protein DRG82_09115 [Deltaproteobacteria bacterium]